MKRIHTGRVHRVEIADAIVDASWIPGVCMWLILAIILLLVLLGTLPTWPYSRSWGYYPFGGVGVVVAIVILLWLLGIL